MLDVVDFNLSPNIRWFVRLAAAAAIEVELYGSAANAQAQENRLGHGSAVFGAAAQVTITADPDLLPAPGEPIAKFNPALGYHLKVSGESGDAAKIFAIGPFTDLDAIEDPLMLSEAVIRARAELEINRGTHSRALTSVSLARHYPELDEGAIVTLTSTRRSMDAVRQRVLSHAIAGSIDDSGRMEIADELETVEYVDFKKA
jgi:hypothetical protein